MRHLKTGRILNRTSSHRKALFNNMVTSLVIHEKIVTTLAKAKELRGKADKIITLAKRGDLHARRQALKSVKDKAALAKLFDTLGPRYEKRNGGYTRIYHLGSRVGDSAKMAVLEWVDREIKEKKETKEKTKAPAKKESKTQKADKKPVAQKETKKTKLEEKKKVMPKKVTKKKESFTKNKSK